MSQRTANHQSKHSNPTVKKHKIPREIGKNVRLIFS